MEKAVQRLAGTYLKDVVSILICNVDSVDQANRKCDCTPIGGDANTSLPGVLLCAENNNGLVVFPTVGSTVIVALSNRNTAFVLMYSDVDSIQFMDGSLGGMVKVIDLVTKLNNLENLLNGFIALYNAHVHTANNTPTVSLETNTLVPTVRADVENTLILQGINP